MQYTIEEHRFRYAAWAASRAASATHRRFKVSAGRELLAAAKLHTMVRSWDELPTPEDFDDQHRGWRQTMKEHAPRYISFDEGRKFTDGIAAKLINVYLKSLFLGGVPHLRTKYPAAIRQKMNAIHPPIDRLLLDVLYRKAKDSGGSLASHWKARRDGGWSNFDDRTYEATIADIRAVTAGELWRIEADWIGHQGDKAISFDNNS